MTLQLFFFLRNQNQVEPRDPAGRISYITICSQKGEISYFGEFLIFVINW